MPGSTKGSDELEQIIAMWKAGVPQIEKVVFELNYAFQITKYERTVHATGTLIGRANHDVFLELRDAKRNPIETYNFDRSVMKCLVGGTDLVFHRQNRPPVLDPGEFSLLGDYMSRKLGNVRTLCAVTLFGPTELTGVDFHIDLKPLGGNRAGLVVSVPKGGNADFRRLDIIFNKTAGRPESVTVEGVDGTMMALTIKGTREQEQRDDWSIMMKGRSVQEWPPVSPDGHEWTWSWAWTPQSAPAAIKKEGKGLDVKSGPVPEQTVGEKHKGR
jgi:hypothetical protein